MVLGQGSRKIWSLFGGILLVLDVVNSGMVTYHYPKGRPHPLKPNSGALSNGIVSSLKPDHSPITAPTFSGSLQLPSASSSSPSQSLHGLTSPLGVVPSLQSVSSQNQDKNPPPTSVSNPPVQFSINSIQRPPLPPNPTQAQIISSSSQNTPEATPITFQTSSTENGKPPYLQSPPEGTGSLVSSNTVSYLPPPSQNQNQNQPQAFQKPPSTQTQPPPQQQQQQPHPPAHGSGAQHQQQAPPQENQAAPPQEAPQHQQGSQQGPAAPHQQEQGKPQASQQDAQPPPPPQQQPVSVPVQSQPQPQPAPPQDAVPPQTQAVEQQQQQPPPPPPPQFASFNSQTQQTSNSAANQYISDNPNGSQGQYSYQQVTQQEQNLPPPAPAPVLCTLSHVGPAPETTPEVLASPAHYHPTATSPEEDDDEGHFNIEQYLAQAAQFLGGNLTPNTESQPAPAPSLSQVPATPSVSLEPPQLLGSPPTSNQVVTMASSNSANASGPAMIVLTSNNHQGSATTTSLQNYTVVHSPPSELLTSAPAPASEEAKPEEGEMKPDHLFEPIPVPVPETSPEFLQEVQAPVLAPPPPVLASAEEPSSVNLEVQLQVDSSSPSTSEVAPQTQQQPTTYEVTGQDGNSYIFVPLVPMASSSEHEDDDYPPFNVEQYLAQAALLLGGNSGNPVVLPVETAQVAPAPSLLDDIATPTGNIPEVQDDVPEVLGHHEEGHDEADPEPAPLPLDEVMVNAEVEEDIAPEEPSILGFFMPSEVVTSMTTLANGQVETIVATLLGPASASIEPSSTVPTSEAVSLQTEAVHLESNELLGESDLPVPTPEEEAVIEEHVEVHEQFNFHPSPSDEVHAELDHSEPVVVPEELSNEHEEILESEATPSLNDHDHEHISDPMSSSEDHDDHGYDHDHDHDHQNANIQEVEMLHQTQPEIADATQQQADPTFGLAGVSGIEEVAHDLNDFVPQPAQSHMNYYSNLPEYQYYYPVYYNPPSPVESPPSTSSEEAPVPSVESVPLIPIKDIDEEPENPNERVVGSGRPNRPFSVLSGRPSALGIAPVYTYSGGNLNLGHSPFGNDNKIIHGSVSAGSKNSQNGTLSMMENAVSNLHNKNPHVNPQMANVMSNTVYNSFLNGASGGGGQSPANILMTQTANKVPNMPMAPTIVALMPQVGIGNSPYPTGESQPIVENQDQSSQTGSSQNQNQQPQNMYQNYYFPQDSVKNASIFVNNGMKNPNMMTPIFLPLMFHGDSSKSIMHVLDADKTMNVREDNRGSKNIVELLAQEEGKRRVELKPVKRTMPKKGSSIKNVKDTLSPDVPEVKVEEKVEKVPQIKEEVNEEPPKMEETKPTEEAPKAEEVEEEEEEKVLPESEPEPETRPQPRPPPKQPEPEPKPPKQERPKEAPSPGPAPGTGPQGPQLPQPPPPPNMVEIPTLPEAMNVPTMMEISIPDPSMDMPIVPSPGEVPDIMGGFQLPSVPKPPGEKMNPDAPEQAGKKGNTPKAKPGKKPPNPQSKPPPAQEPQQKPQKPSPEPQPTKPSPQPEKELDPFQTPGGGEPSISEDDSFTMMEESSEEMTMDTDEHFDGLDNSIESEDLEMEEPQPQPQPMPPAPKPEKEKVLPPPPPPPSPPKQHEKALPDRGGKPLRPGLGGSNQNPAPAPNQYDKADCPCANSNANSNSNYGNTEKNNPNPSPPSPPSGGSKNPNKNPAPAPTIAPKPAPAPEEELIEEEPASQARPPRPTKPKRPPRPNKGSKGKPKPGEKYNEKFKDTGDDEEEPEEPKRDPNVHVVELTFIISRNKTASNNSDSSKESSSKNMTMPIKFTVRPPSPSPAPAPSPAPSKLVDLLQSPSPAPAKAPVPKPELPPPPPPSAPVDTPAKQQSELFNMVPIPLLGWDIPVINWSFFTDYFSSFFGKNFRTSSGAFTCDELDDESPDLRTELEVDYLCGDNVDFSRADGIMAAVADSNSNVCNMFCTSNGFHSGICMPQKNCMCYITKDKNFAIKLERLMDYPTSNATTVNAVKEPDSDLGDLAEGSCQNCKCLKTCQSRGKYVGYCSKSCHCGVPWYSEYPSKSSSQQ